MQNHYRPPNPDLWQGRDDGDGVARFFQTIQLRHLLTDKLPQTQGNYALLGFCSDVGVTRNLGRQGSADGPHALRQALANLTLQQALACVDVGDIVCHDENLEGAQAALAQAITLLLNHGYKPCVLGGGHETAWGHYLGLAEQATTQKLGIINIDAHFDLRQPKAGLSTSGTPFYQIAKHREQQGLAFSYFCLGIQTLANTPQLFATAHELDVKYVLAEMLQSQTGNTLQAQLQAYLESHDKIYLSICLDAFAQAVAPGVSAPQALGLLPHTILPYLHQIMASQKVISLDIVELAPCYDRDNMTARLAATMLAQLL